MSGPVFIFEKLDHNGCSFKAVMNVEIKPGAALYLHPDPRVAELEAVLRECRGVLMHYQYGGSSYKEPADKAIAKIDEVLNVPDISRTA